MKNDTWAKDFLDAVAELRDDDGSVRFTMHSSREGADDWPTEPTVHA
ncbi:hypothetical protein ACFXPX_13560 [Kitasatospora sp. NPDC059146]